jgi:hypothetical protein
MARALAALALAGFLAGTSACGAQSQPPGIRIVRATVIGSDVILRVKITGWTMAAPDEGPVPKPRTGQWQIFADNRYAGFSYEPTYGLVTGLAAGTYRIWVVLARTDYSLVYPLIRSPSIIVRIRDNRIYKSETA